MPELFFIYDALHQIAKLIKIRSATRDHGGKFIVLNETKKNQNDDQKAECDQYKLIRVIRKSINTGTNFVGVAQNLQFQTSFGQR